MTDAVRAASERLSKLTAYLLEQHALSQSKLGQQQPLHRRSSSQSSADSHQQLLAAPGEAGDGPQRHPDLPAIEDLAAVNSLLDLKAGRSPIDALAAPKRSKRSRTSGAKGRQRPARSRSQPLISAFQAMLPSEGES